MQSDETGVLGVPPGPNRIRVGCGLDSGIGLTGVVTTGDTDNEEEEAIQEDCPEPQDATDELDVVMDIDGIPHSVRATIVIESGVVEVSDIVVTRVT